MTWHRLHPAERAAALIFVTLFASTFIEAWLYRRLWILGIGALGLIWFSAILAGVVYTSTAFRDAGLHGKAKVRAVAAIPVAIAIVLFSKFGLGLGHRAEASAFLLLHREEMLRAQTNVGPGEPVSLTFVQGIPDGGEAIIRSNKEPTHLSQIDQVKLTGETNQMVQRDRARRLALWLRLSCA